MDRSTEAPIEDPPTVTDHRPVPRGVLPRGIQTWILAGVALCMLVVMLVFGHREPPPRPTTPATATTAPNTDRVRDYQERMRGIEAQLLRETQTAPPVDQAATPQDRPVPAPDPIAAERKRRDYESLFASNVVLSRRTDAERPDAGTLSVGLPEPTSAARGTPSVDDIAAAAVRATARAAGAMANATPATAAPAGPVEGGAARQSAIPDRTDPIDPAGPLHRILEGTLIDAVLTNRLDAASTAPVNCLVTTPLYSHSGHVVVIPAGARVLGSTRPVQAFGETRLAVAFHRLVMPDGRTFRLDRFVGLNQVGDAGLRDRVNQHYLSTFGAAAAVGLISGLAQAVGSAGVSSGDGERTVVIAGGVGDASSQASLQVMNRLLNRLPTITIREGHRVKVYLTSDLELPSYAPSRVDVLF